MDYKIEFPNKNTAVIDFTVPAEQWLANLEQAAEKVGKDHEDEAREYAAALAAGPILSEAAAQHNLKLATKPIMVTETNDDGSASITMTLTLVPEVKLGQYTELGVRLTPVEVEEEEVMSDVMRRISAQKLWEKLPAGTKAENGNQVIIDFVGEKDGIPFEGGSAQNYPLVLGSGSFIPGFEEQLLGIEEGQSRDVNVEFPKDYFEQSLAGAPVVFHVTCHAVEQEIKPELNDAFIEKMKLDGVKTVEDLKAKAHAEMLEMKTQEAENQLAMELLSKIADGSEVEIPQAMVENQVQQHLQEYEQNLQQYGMNFEQFLQASGQTMESFRERLVPQAEAELKSALVLEAIAEKEQITASDEELEEEYKLLSSVYSFPPEQLKMLIPADAVKYQIAQKKTLDFLKKANA